MNLRSGTNLPLQPHFIVNSVSSMIECAKQGIGLVQLLFYMVKALQLKRTHINDKTIFDI